MDASSFFGLFYPLVLGWIGDTTIASIFWLIIITLMSVKFGIGADAGIMIGGGILLLFALVFPVGGMTALVVFGLMAIAAGGVLRYLRK